MLITLGNVNAKVAQATDAERDWLNDYLSFEDSRSHFRRQHGGGSGKTRMYNAWSQTFPTGFLSLVEKGAAREGYTIEVIDRRRCEVRPDDGADIAWLRWYQREAVEAVVRETRGILWLPTGAGKTELFAALTRRIPGRWLFVVHRTTLARQAADRVRLRTGAEVGVCGEGEWQGFSDERRVVCATFQTLAARLKERDAEANDLLQAVDGLIVDEAHVTPADTHLRVTQACPAYWRVGLSGTPLARSDRRSVLAIAALGKVIYRIKPDVLIDEGVLARPRITMIPIVQTSEKPTYQGVYGELIVRSRQRNAAVITAVRTAEKPCMIFVREIAHGKLLEQALGKAGITSAFVSGEHSTEWRESHIQRLRKGHFDALIASVVFQEGVDIPDLRSVVIASGGASVIAALQRIGRGMRVSEGKTTFEVVDFNDQGHRWTERHSRARLRAYVGEGYDVIEASPVLGSVG